MGRIYVVGYKEIVSKSQHIATEFKVYDDENPTEEIYSGVETDLAFLYELRFNATLNGSQYFVSKSTRVKFRFLYSNGDVSNWYTPTKNLSHTQTFEDSVMCNKVDPTVIKLCDPITIQPNKKVSLDISLPTRCNSLGWGGLYLNLNVKINGTWYNLGNGGQEGGVMEYSAKTIDRYNRHFLFDFISVLGLPDDQPFTMQVELVGLSYDSDVEINGSHDINAGGGGKLTTRGDVHPILSKQNFSTVIVKEKDR